MEHMPGSRHLAMAFSVLVGFGAAAAIYLGSYFAIMSAGLEMLLRRGEAISGLSFALIVVSLMLGWRVGAALWDGSLRAGMSANDRLGFRAWLIGILAFGLVSGITNALVARMESWSGAAIFTAVHIFTLLALVAILSHLLSRWKAVHADENDGTRTWGERQ